MRLVFRSSLCASFLSGFCFHHSYVIDTKMNEINENFVFTFGNPSHISLYDFIRCVCFFFFVELLPHLSEEI